jgi:hypothetical protein
LGQRDAEVLGELVVGPAPERPELASGHQV